MRLFIAIDLPEEAKKELVSIQEKIGSADAKISWVAKKNLHLTLKFLGEVSDENAANIKRVLKGIAVGSFELELNRFGAFPSIDNPKVLWVGLEPEKDVIKLAQKIDAETLNFSEQNAEFKAHLTIGRVKLIKFKKEFVEKLKKVKVFGIYFKIDSFTLYKSTLTREGAIYEVVEKYKLE